MRNRLSSATWSSAADVREAALNPMRELHKLTHQAVNLSVRQGDEIVYIERARQRTLRHAGGARGRQTPAAPDIGGRCSSPMTILSVSSLRHRTGAGRPDPQQHHRVVKI